MQIRGVVLVALSGMLFGWMGFFGTRLFELGLSIENMLFWRFFMAVVWMAGAMLLSRRIVDNRRIVVARSAFQRRSNPVFDFVLESGQPQSKVKDWIASSLKSAPRNDDLLRQRRRPATTTILRATTFILSAIAYSAASAFYFMASREIGTGLAMVIFYSFPVFVALIAWCSGTWKMNIIAFCALFAVLSGLFLLKGSGEEILDITGICFGVIAAICFASYVYGSKFTIKKYDSMMLTLSVCIGNMLIFFVWSCYTNTFVIPSSLNAWLFIFAIGVIATALPIQFLLDGLKYLGPLKASVLSALEPVVTLLVGFMLLDESVTLIQLSGVIVLLSGAILIQFEPEQGRKQNDTQ